MTILSTVVKKLDAWDAGYPIPRYETIHHVVAPPGNSLIVAFLRMAGESRPWGIAWGKPGSDLKVASVPDGRIRDDVSIMAAEFAEDLLEHMRVHNWTYDPAPQKPDPSDLRQVWLPNSQHIAMLHHLSYAYSQTRFGGQNQEILRALGRLAGWMFRDTARVGNQHVVNASQFLQQSFVFPAQDTRLGHLGFELAWLRNSGSRSDRIISAEIAERQSVSPTMAPELDRDQLSGLVTRWHSSSSPEIANEIASILASELERRWKLTLQAYETFNNIHLPINPGVQELVKEAHAEFWFQHQRIELRLNDPSLGPAFVAHPETDFHGSAAASRYLTQVAANEAYIGNLIHHDSALFAEALEDGRAFRAEVTAVTDVGTGRTSRPRWTLKLEPSVPTRLREAARISPYGSRGHEATVVELQSFDDSLSVVIEWTGRKTKALSSPVAAKPGDSVWEGLQVAFVQSDAATLTQRRSRRVWAAAKGPGAWLTHGKASVRIEENDEDGVDVLYDDVAQIADGVDV